MKTFVVAIFKISFLTAVISFLVCLFYEIQIKSHMKKEGIADRFYRGSMIFLSLFGFYLGDYEGKISNEKIKEKIYWYKKCRMVLVVSISFLFISHIIKLIILT